MSIEPYTNVPVYKRIEKAFLLKRLHSLTGLFFIFFLIEHLLTNSESAFFLGEDGKSFIHSVNFLHSLPYLEAIEIFALGIPLGIHMLLGFVYLFKTLYNVFPSNGATPSLHYFRNATFTLQRVTALFLVFGLIAHVASMRFLQTPKQIPNYSQYYLPLSPDPGLLTLAPRLDTIILTESSRPQYLDTLRKQLKTFRQLSEVQQSDSLEQRWLFDASRLENKIALVTTQESSPETWLSIAPDFGTSCLLLVRDTFKSWYQIILYTVFVLMAAFHAGNGLWTFSITWGITLNEQGRRLVRILGVLLATMFSIWGLSSIFGTYFFNLYQ